jgi:hypothetical protein
VGRRSSVALLRHRCSRLGAIACRRATTLSVAPGSLSSARSATLRATLQRRRVLPPVLPSAMLRFSAIGTTDIRRSPRRKISVDRGAAARRGTGRRSLSATLWTTDPIGVSVQLSRSLTAHGSCPTASSPHEPSPGVPR